MLSTESIEKREPELEVVESPTPVAIEDYIAETRHWWHVPHLRLTTFCVFLITLSSTISGYDGSMLNGLQSLYFWQKDMGHPAGQRLGALSNGTLFGNIAAIPITPFLCDRFGRKPIIMLGAIVVVIGAILQGVSNSYGFFLAARVILGIGGTLAAVPSPTLISEISYPTHRETATFSYNVCWYLGAIIASWVTYGTRNLDGKASWGIPSYLQGALPVFQLAFFWLVPESPRYLINKGRMEKARAVLSKFHTGNLTDPRDIALIDFEISEIEVALANEKSQQANAKYLDFITKPNFRKRLFLCVFTGIMMQLSGNGLVSYYLVKVLESIGITETTKQLEINGCLMIYNFVICCVMCSICRLVKRRTLFLTCVSGMLVSYVIWTILSALNEQRNFEDTNMANGVLAMIFFFYLFYDVGVNGLPFLYVTEILPYSHRAKGVNLFQFTQLVVLVYNGYVNPIAMDAIGWKYYIVFCCILAVELIVVYFTYPETSGYTLEEVAQVFGDEPPRLQNRTLQSDKASLEHVERVEQV